MWKLTVTIVAILIGVAIALFTPIGEKLLQVLTNPAPEIQLVSSTDVARDIVQFVAGAQKEDGGFTGKFRCEGSTCQSLEVRALDASGYAIVSLLTMSKKTSDASLRAAADIAIDKVIRECQNDVRICERNFFALDAYYQDTAEPRFRSALESVGSYVLESLREATSINVANRNLSKKLETLYVLTGDSTYRDALLATAEQAYGSWKAEFSGEPLYMAGTDPVYTSTPAIFAGIFLPAYRVSGEEKYLDASVNFYKNAKIDEYLAAFQWEGGMTSVLKAAEAMLVLSDLDGVLPVDQLAFENRARNILQRIIAWQYDSGMRPIFDGQGDIVTGVTSRTELPGVNYKSTNLNAWVALLLMDERFVSETYQLQPIQ